MKNTKKPAPTKPAKPAKETVTETVEDNTPKPTPGENGQQIEPAGSPYGPPKED